ncbi:MAG: putative fumarylacetoacetate hydrolase [Sphingomonadales bacterium]|nr:putative fumarylacetoacetate hydrolase [Sphingomonadales bacterium]
MRLASFVVDGRETYGLVVEDDGLIDLGAVLVADAPDLITLIASGRAHELTAPFADRPVDYRFGEVRFLPSLPHPGVILSGGGNFPKHIAEMTRGGLRNGPPANPVFHVKSPRTLVGHMEPLVKPAATETFDWENEFAVVIGKGGRHVSRDQAMDHVFGYCILQDGSMRDFQFDHSPAAGKSFFRSSSLGPWIMTADEIGDISTLMVRTRLNGATVQEECVGDLSFPIDLLISYYSTIFPLRPGDIITSGSAGGVGYFMEPPTYMVAGDEIEFEVDRLGVMKHRVIDEAEDD